MSAFVYLWINKNTKQWYVGSRTAKNAMLTMVMYALVSMCAP